ncbi:MAG: hypothetical protein ACLFS3_03570 [Candidatus Aenigmatarchaeota archaeon]
MGFKDKIMERFNSEEETSKEYSSLGFAEKTHGESYRNTMEKTIEELEEKFDEVEFTAGTGVITDKGGYEDGTLDIEYGNNKDFQRIDIGVREIGGTKEPVVEGRELGEIDSHEKQNEGQVSKELNKVLVEKYNTR